ncbi:MAG: acyltransferase family protein, partial [Prevotella sp.]|nr:acyltransferase family protein [Prevotella sp.]
MATKTRDPFWDTLKAMLIVLVVLGHTGTAMGDRWLSVIYAFHMPLFIFISGYFSKKQSFSLLGGGNKRLIILFLVFNTAYLSLDVALGGSIGLHRLLSPAFALWYILSLIYWR